MKGAVRRDKAYADRLMPQVIQVLGQTLGPQLIRIAPPEWDMKEATDLVILHMHPKTIGVRVRRPGYTERFPYDFTIRYARDSGAETEYSKIAHGWGDVLFYGHTSGPGDSPLLSDYWIINLDVFRFALIDKGWRDQIKRTLQPNHDSETWFLAFDVRSFPPDILLGASRPLSPVNGARPATPAPPEPESVMPQRPAMTLLDLM